MKPICIFCTATTLCPNKMDCSKSDKLYFWNACLSLLYETCQEHKDLGKGKQEYCVEVSSSEALSIYEFKDAENLSNYIMELDAVNRHIGKYVFINLLNRLSLVKNNLNRLDLVRKIEARLSTLLGLNEDESAMLSALIMCVNANAINHHELVGLEKKGFNPKVIRFLVEYFTSITIEENKDKIDKDCFAPLINNGLSEEEIQIINSHERLSRENYRLMESGKGVFRRVT